MVFHPLFVHLHIAFLLMAFLSMWYWLLKGLSSSVFEDRIYRFARACTWLGVIFVALSMAAGVRDGFAGRYAVWGGQQGGWLLVKASLAFTLLIVYGFFLYLSSKKPRYLQEEPRLLVWCMLTQTAGMAIVVTITAIGTMLVYYPWSLPRFHM